MTSRSTLRGTAPARASGPKDWMASARRCSVHPAGVGLDDLPGGQGGPVGDQQGGLVVAQAGDGELADRAGVGRQGRFGVVVHFDAAGLVPGPAEAHRGPGAGGQGGQGRGDAGGRARRAMNPTLRWSSSARTAWVVSLESKISSAGSDPMTAVGPGRTVIIGNSGYPNYTALARRLHDYLCWRNAHARHPNVLAAQCLERARIRSERQRRWSRPKTKAAGPIRRTFVAIN
jgi:hypothetical protein